ncbi:hypothetical protein L6164_030680 [Bauhinia variegata]|uniref:Uncharacterized protein n=1 Tax=Bauhinia variegata TaxID=167791 RepID=A0ACB9LDG9_BAUVA|nr:hypothetical protein L6164_030680 [Bauhinia variegata]
MLQRAARNAYTWWWASHVRTKQSKWLEESLRDMDEKVAYTLRILNDDGDSFAKRAEMYYRKRPELVEFAEEAFRAYRSLAERYDHLSRELQSANRTIASVFPERVQYPLDQDDEESDLGTSLPSNDPDNPKVPPPSIPEVPKIPKKEFRSPSMLLTRRGTFKRLSSSKKAFTSAISGLNKDEALAEIDKLQKEILALQTEKEFVRSLFERAYEKYWEIEDQITVMQKRVGNLQDEFGVGRVIDDNEARTLMAATALKSCQETLAKLQDIQAQSSEEAKVEYQRVKEAHEMFENLKDQFISKHASRLVSGDGDKSEITAAEIRSIDEEMAILEQEGNDMRQLREKIKERLQEDTTNSITATEMADRIDDLVNKVVSLETAVSSQTGLIKRLRSDTDELQTHMRSLEEDNVMLIQGSDHMKMKLEELEEELRKVKNLNRNVKYQDKNLKTHFTEATCNLEHLSGKLQTVKLDEEDSENMALYKKESSAPGSKPVKESEEGGDKVALYNSEVLKDVGTIKEEKEVDIVSLSGPVRNEENKAEQDKDYKDSLSEIESQDNGAGEENEPNWRQMFINGSDDREKNLLDEYTAVLRNYKDVRTKLNDVERRNRDSIVELAIEVRELRNAVDTRDKEIHFLHDKLVSSETNIDESPLTAITEYKYTPREGLLESAAKLQNPDSSPSNLDGNIAGHEKRNSLQQMMALEDDKRRGLSTMERKFRSDIDDLLEENLEFWLRFSTSVHQIQKFQNSVQDLQAELSKIKGSYKQEGSSNSRKQHLQSEIRPIFKHMREIRTELSLWVEHNAVLQDELHGRYSSLCDIQDDIARANSAGSEADNAELSAYQAAKFQGEVLNMKQENTKVASELQAGLSLVKGLKNEVEKTLAELDEEFGVNNFPSQKQAPSRARIPLRSFLFGVKLKKQKQASSLFACVNPAYSNLEAAGDLPT